MCDGYGSYDLDSKSEYIQYISYSKLNVYDIGKNSLELLKYYIESSDIIFWNGSLGVIEHKDYKKGSLELLDFLFNQKNKTIIIGGGETASLINDKTNLGNVYVSTGGGALLEYLQNKRIIKESTSNTLLRLYFNKIFSKIFLKKIFNFYINIKWICTISFSFTIRFKSFNSIHNKIINNNICM